MFCTGLLFSIPGSARNSYGIQNTPEGVFFTRQCKGHIRHSKYTSGWCKIVLHWSAVSLLDSARNTHGIKNTPEGGVRLYYICLLFLYQAVHDIQNSPEGDLIIYYTKPYVFFIRQCKEHTFAFKRTRG